jgi:hypothetical protein
VVTLVAVVCLFVLTSRLPWVVVVIFAFALFAAGGWLHQAGKLQARLGDGEWKLIPMLGGWEPRTREQLDAVETLLGRQREPCVRPALRRQLRKRGLDSGEWIAVARHLVLDDGD